MEIDTFTPPYVPGGLHSLLVASIDDPQSGLTSIHRSIIPLLELYFCNKEIKSILKTVRINAYNTAIGKSANSSDMVDCEPSSDWMHGCKNIWNIRATCI
jgi:hypothetical protein